MNENEAMVNSMEENQTIDFADTSLPNPDEFDQSNGTAVLVMAGIASAVTAAGMIMSRQLMKSDKYLNWRTERANHRDLQKRKREAIKEVKQKAKEEIKKIKSGEEPKENEVE